MPIKTKVYNQKAEEAGTMELPDEVFNIEINEGLVHQAMVAQLGNERQVLAHTKDRSEVSGGGKKPWRQKGTGRARAGSSRSPIWIGGGVTFGPTKERNFKKDINRKMKRKAIAMVLSDKVKENRFIVLDIINFTEFKTKSANEMIEKLEAKKDSGIDKEPKKSVLIVNDAKDEKTKYSFRNLSGVKIINLENINILDLLKYKNLIITKEGALSIGKLYK